MPPQRFPASARRRSTAGLLASAAPAWVAALGCFGAIACHEEPPPPAAAATASMRAWPAAATADRAGAACADVATLRVCWGPGPEIVPRVLPAAPASAPMGWRCARARSDRACVDRRAGAPPFACAGGVCTQRHPRMPDDGDWSCADSGGATVCVGGGRPAGVAPAPADPAWICGERRVAVAAAAAAGSGGAAGELGSRVCVDLSPDFPDGVMVGWRCHTLYDPAQSRVCRRDPTARTLAQPCDARRPCVDGGVCARAQAGGGEGRCVPPRPAPDCWLDSDCPGRRCRFGSCLESGP